MPAMIRATPASSIGAGICAKTRTPITVAVTGRNATISAKPARARRRMANWSAM